MIAPFVGEITEGPLLPAEDAPEGAVALAWGAAFLAEHWKGPGLLRREYEPVSGDIVWKPHGGVGYIEASDVYLWVPLWEAAP